MHNQGHGVEVGAPPGGITPGSTVITGGTDTRVLFDDNGVVGESAGLTYVKSTGALTSTSYTGRVIKRTTTVTSSTTSVTISVATTDMHITTAQAGALLYNNPTGSPNEGQGLLIRIKDDGTARALTWDTQFRAGALSLPTTTVVSQTLYMAFIFNSTDTKWDFIGTQGGF